MQKKGKNDKTSIHLVCQYTQCALGIFNLDQKFHGLSCFRVFIHVKELRISQEKYLSSGFQKGDPQKKSLSILKLAYQGHFLAMFIVVNFGSPMTDVFLD